MSQLDEQPTGFGAAPFLDVLHSVVDPPLVGLKVVIVVENNPVPFDRRVWQESRSLAKSGAEVSVICPTGHGYDKPDEVLDGIRVLRHPLPLEVSSAAGYLREYLAALRWEARLLRRLWRESHFDVIEICNPPDILFVAALPYLLRGVKLIYDHHDRAPELYEAKYGKRGFFYRALLAAEKVTFRLASVVLAPNQTHAEVAVSRGGVRPERVFVVQSCPDPQEFHPTERVDLSGLPFRQLVGYFGIMGEQDGVELLLEAARHIVLGLGRTDVGFLLIGGGPARDRLVVKSEEMGIAHNTRFMGYVERHYGAALLDCCEVCVAPDPKNVYTDGCSMNKVMEYLLLAKPIVQFDLVEDRRIAGEAAVYATGNDPIAFGEALVELLDDPAAMARLSSLASSRAQEFSWLRQEQALVSAYQEVRRRIGVTK